MSAATSFARELPVAKSMLGKNVVVEGHIRSQEDLIIEGEVEGTIDMTDHRLTIATNAKVRANVKVREIEVLGSIEGKIEAAGKVYIRKSHSLLATFVPPASSSKTVGTLKEGSNCRASQRTASR